MWKSIVAAGSLLALSFSSLADPGGVSFTRSRMVLKEADKAISIAVQNHGDTPYLIQTGVSNEGGSRAPFLVTPPLFRLEGNAQNMMRIVKVSAALPQDRESVFYYYATAIPGQEKSPGDSADDSGARGEVGAQLAIAMKTVLKLFYRPKNLPVTIDEAHGMMRFVQDGERVVIKNPTPYYQSFASLTFDGVAQDLDRHPSMVAPMSDLNFPVGKRVSKVTWTVMTDYGGVTERVTQDVAAK